MSRHAYDEDDDDDDDINGDDNDGSRTMLVSTTYHKVYTMRRAESRERALPLSS